MNKCIKLKLIEMHLFLIDPSKYLMFFFITFI